MVLRDERNRKHDAAPCGEVVGVQRVEDASRIAARGAWPRASPLERHERLRDGAGLVEALLEEEPLEPEAQQAHAVRTVRKRRERRRAVEKVERARAPALLDEHGRGHLRKMRHLHEPERVLRVRDRLFATPKDREDLHEQAVAVARAGKPLEGRHGREPGLLAAVLRKQRAGADEDRPRVSRDPLARLLRDPMGVIEETQLRGHERAAVEPRRGHVDGESFGRGLAVAVEVEERLDGARSRELEQPFRAALGMIGPLARRSLGQELRAARVAAVGEDPREPEPRLGRTAGSYELAHTLRSAERVDGVDEASFVDQCLDARPKGERPFIGRGLRAVHRRSILRLLQCSSTYGEAISRRGSAHGAG